MKINVIEVKDNDKISVFNDSFELARRNAEKIWSEQ